MGRSRLSYFKQFLFVSILLHIGVVLLFSNLISIKLFEAREKIEEPFLVKVFEEPTISIPEQKIVTKQRTGWRIEYEDLWFIPHGKDGIVSKPLEDGEINGINGMKNIHLAEHVYQIIDGKLHYPGELIESELEGIVSAHLTFDEKGNFQYRDLKVKSNSNYLKVYVCRLLRSALIYKIPSNIINYKGKFNLKANFKFESVTLDDDDLIERESYFSGNSLFFYRNYVKSNFAWKLGPLSGKYYWHPDLAPNIVEIDVLATINLIHSLFTDKKPEDPLVKYRNDPSW